MQNGNTGAYLYSHISRKPRQRIHGNIFLLVLTIAVTGLFSHATSAGELSLLVNGKAIHINPAKKNLNEKNWGAGVEYNWDLVNQKWIPFATVSGFKDSNRNPSYYAGGGMMRRWNFGSMHVDAGGIGFAMVRKNFKHDRPFLGVLPAFSAGNSRFALNMTYIPKVEPKAVPLVFFQLKITLKNT